MGVESRSNLDKDVNRYEVQPVTVDIESLWGKIQSGEATSITTVQRDALLAEKKPIDKYVLTVVPTEQAAVDYDRTESEGPDYSGK